uniref:Uncharacterized protein n=1 Tax=Timema bartmani TaxID=61472 RepID=A0A7R9F6N5_9NEOP|nr:unnamed protein product [Timema bartmani]
MKMHANRWIKPVLKLQLWDAASFATKSFKVHDKEKSNKTPIFFHLYSIYSLSKYENVNIFKNNDATEKGKARPSCFMLSI